MKNSRGFTLIELLIVMAIIMGMMVWLLPGILTGQRTAQENECRKHMLDLYQASITYKTRKGGSLPPGGGTTFLWQLWKSGCVSNDEKGRSLFFCPEVVEVAQPPELAIPVEKIGELWPTAESFTNQSTHYAVRALEHKRSMNADRAVWMADDNEGGWNHQNQLINVLYSGGTVGSIDRDTLLELQLWEAAEDDEAYVFPVGPQSPHPELQKLTPYADQR